MSTIAARVLAVILCMSLILLRVQEVLHTEPLAYVRFMKVYLLSVASVGVFCFLLTKETTSWLLGSDEAPAGCFIVSVGGLMLFTVALLLVLTVEANFGKSDSIAIKVALTAFSGIALIALYYWGKLLLRALYELPMQQLNCVAIVIGVPLQLVYF